MIETTITFQHEPTIAFGDDGDLNECDEVELTVTMDWEPPEPEVGIMSVAFIDHDYPYECPVCGHVYTDKEQTEIMKMAEENVIAAQPDGDYDEY